MYRPASVEVMLGKKLTTSSIKKWSFEGIDIYYIRYGSRNCLPCARHCIVRSDPLGEALRGLLLRGPLPSTPTKINPNLHVYECTSTRAISSSDTYLTSGTFIVADGPVVGSVLFDVINVE